jgi:hypothetical protein
MAKELQEDRKVEPLLEKPIEENVEQEKQTQHIVLAEDQVQENVLTLDLIRKKARLCQKRSRARAEKELAKSLTSKYEPNLDNLELSINSIHRKSNAIVHFITKELDSCLVFFACQAILEQVFAHEIIVPSLPEYYPRPHEVKA